GVEPLHLAVRHVHPSSTLTASGVPPGTVKGRRRPGGDDNRIPGRAGQARGGVRDLTEGYVVVGAVDLLDPSGLLMSISVSSARRLPGLAASAVLVAAALTTSTAAQASSPAEGSISDTSTSVSWGGGPFVAPNPTAQASGQPDCTVPSSCD